MKTEEILYKLSRSKFRNSFKLKEKDIKFFLDLEVHEYRVNDEISLDKEFLVQDPDGYLLRFNN